jgi:hypothetical protein
MSDGVTPVLLWAAGGGTLTSLASNVVAFATHQANLAGTELSRCQERGLFVVYIVLSLGGVLFFMISTKYGPVALAMPVQTATTLFATMIFQSTGGIKPYTKAMRVGTVVLVAASSCLVAVGPTVPQEEQNVIALVENVSSILWILLMTVTLLLAVSTLRKSGLSDSQRLVLYAYVVADSTALGASVGKMLTVAEDFVLVVCGLSYILLGAASLLFGAAASAACDMSIFLPVSQCLQLLINAATGLFVWGDAKRIQAPLAYTMVYVLICMGAYLLSAFDVMTSIARRMALRSVPISNEVLNISSPMNDPFWRKIADIERSWSHSDSSVRSSDLKDVLTIGLDYGELETEACADLVAVLSKLVGDQSPDMLQRAINDWISQHVRRPVNANPVATAMALTPVP